MQHPSCWEKGSAIKTEPRILVFRLNTRYYNSVWALVFRLNTRYYNSVWAVDCGLTFVMRRVGAEHIMLSSFTFVVDHGMF